MDHQFPKTVTRQELLLEDSDAKFRKLLYEITALADRVETMRATFARHFGITRPQYNILFYIAQHQRDVGLTTRQVATALRVSSPHVVQEVNQLVRANLIEKSPNPDDGRSVLLRVSERGFVMIDDLAPTLRDVNDRLFQSISKSEFDQLCRLVTTILEDAEGVISKLPVD
ncbi:MarR family winged helix-turn-helix transcriptional regulator [Epibacterium ulvae]|uniref:MarR family winged helix-turn-helix transcriptional regulator n=1 Tax=Epibacterium ulvae TaxID=1156985 RepID=UPI00249010C6|nr:MarR family transcriptional regulator [Epibacterium ulvae]